jgi:ribonuclease Z
VMRIVYGRLPFELGINELDPAEAVQREGYRIAAVPVMHGAREAFGYALVEDERPGEFDPAAAERLGVAPGPDFGRLQQGHTIGGVTPAQVMGPPRQGRKVVLSGDTAPCESLAVAAHEADVLVHEATFLHDEAERARETSHSTARQAAELAHAAAVRMLAMTHISSRYPDREVRAEARAIYPQAEAARDFDTIEVPFPERGPAVLVPWNARQGSEPPGLAEHRARQASGARRPTEPVLPA